MRSFDNLSIGKKSLVPIIGISLLIAVVAGTALTKLSELQYRSSQVVEHTDPALLLEAKSREGIQRLGYDVYRILAYATGTAEETQAQKDFGDTLSSIDRSFDGAATADAARSGDILAFKTRFNTLATALKDEATAAGTTNGYALGTKDTPADIDLGASLARKMVDLDRRIDAMSAELTAFADKIEAQNQADSHALAAATTSAKWTVAVLGLVAVIGGVLAAKWVTSTWIVAPIARLSSQMKSMADGNLDLTVEGRLRADEIGDMAKAVDVFRESGLKRVALEAESKEFQRNLDLRLKEMEASFEEAGRAQKHVVDSLAVSLRKLTEGDLTSRLNSPFASDYEKLRADYNAAVSNLERTVTVGF